MDLSKAPTVIGQVPLDELPSVASILVKNFSNPEILTAFCKRFFVEVPPSIASPLFSLSRSKSRRSLIFDFRSRSLTAPLSLWASQRGFSNGHGMIADYFFCFNDLDFNGLPIPQIRDILNFLSRIPIAFCSRRNEISNIFARLCDALFLTSEVLNDLGLLITFIHNSLLGSLPDEVRAGRLMPEALTATTDATRHSGEDLELLRQTVMDEIKRGLRETVQRLKDVIARSEEHERMWEDWSKVMATERQAGEVVTILLSPAIRRYGVLGKIGGTRLEGSVSGRWKWLDPLVDEGPHEFRIDGTPVCVDAIRFVQAEPVVETDDRSRTVGEITKWLHRIRLWKGRETGFLEMQT
jgi:hypothetical protein